MPLPDVLSNAADALFWRDEVARAYKPAKLSSITPRLQESFGVDRAESVHRYKATVERARAGNHAGWMPDPAERWLGELPALPPDNPDPTKPWLDDQRWRLGPWATYDLARFVTEADRRARALRSTGERTASEQRTANKQLLELEAYRDEGNAGIAASSRIWLPYLADGVAAAPSAPSKIGVW